MAESASRAQEIADTQRSQRSLVNSLSASQPRSKSSAKWLKFTVTLDSGASDSVFPRLAERIHARLGPVTGFKSFCAATEDQVENQGSTVLSMTLADGSQFRSKWSVANVKRALMSTSRVLSLGHSIALHKDESYIKTKDGKKIPLDLSTGVPTFVVRVPILFQGQRNA